MSYLDSIAKKRIGVLGLGVSGIACVSFLMKYRIRPFVMDGNPDSNGIKVVKSGWPRIKVYDELPKADLLIVSPGISPDNRWLVEAKERGVEIIGDVELFARINQKPVIAVTGTNGKSTVTELATRLLQNAGLHAVMGGNIGVPVLNLLASPFDVAVLELSSFQLETTSSLQTRVSVMLNCAEDHMDRYEGLEDYARAKQRIFDHAELAVFNRQDERTRPAHALNQTCSFGLDAPEGGEYGLRDGCFVIGEETICPLDSLKLVGMHNVQNALAAIAVTAPFDVPTEVIADTFEQYRGLPHRCELVEQCGGVRWIDDSKATNVGATVAALEGIAPQTEGQIILIAGGLGKGQDFSPLKQAMERYVSHLIVLGRDGGEIAAQYSGAVSVDSMSSAVTKAAELAQPDDCILLSPACASQDMFRNFEERGDCFAEQVREVCHVH